MIIMLCHVSGTMGTVAFTPLGGIGVALFLFISGYGLNESWKSRGAHQYWWKKIKRVFIPYAIIVTILALWHGIPDIKAFLLDIFGIKTSYWYIGYLLKWYVIFWATTKYIYKYRMPIMILCALFFLILMPNLEAEQSLSFVFGVWVSISADKIKELKPRHIIYLGIASFIVGASFLALKQMPAIRAHESDYIYNIVQLFIKLPFAISIMSAVWFFPTIWHSRLLLFAGAVSYEVYLLHMPFYPMTNGSILYAIALIAASLLAAALFHRLTSFTSRIA